MYPRLGKNHRGRDYGLKWVFQIAYVWKRLFSKASQAKQSRMLPICLQLRWWHKENRYSFVDVECFRAWKACGWNSQHFVILASSSITYHCHTCTPFSSTDFPNVCRDHILFSIQVHIPGLGHTSITLQFILSLAHDKQRKDLYLEFAREITRYKIGRVRLAGWKG